jgi:lantibiotic biosynthesis protein
LTPWHPILSSNSTASAWSAIEAIASAVSRNAYRINVAVDRPDSQAVLFGYMAAIRNDAAWETRATDALNQAIESAEARRTRGLYGGLCGIGWAVEHVPAILRTEGDIEPKLSDDQVAPEDEPDLVADIDDAVLRELRSVPPGEWLGQYDLISGLVGYGVYFLERYPRATAREGLELILWHLEALATKTKDGLSWFSPPRLLPRWQQERCPEGYYNLGVAHGVPGVIYVLNELARRGVERARSESLLEASVCWLLAQRRPPGCRSWFSSWVSSSSESQDSRPRWCYGDLGVLSVLLQVVDRTPRVDWVDFARGLLDHCLSWSIDSSIVEACLCHGAAGNAHLFNRIYQRTGDARCRATAIAWFESALAMRRPDQGVAGFLARRQDRPDAPVHWESRESLLDGDIGIALALLSAVTSVSPHWDRLLLLSARREDLSDERARSGLTHVPSC